MLLVYRYKTLQLLLLAILWGLLNLENFRASECLNLVLAQQLDFLSPGSELSLLKAATDAAVEAWAVALISLQFLFVKRFMFHSKNEIKQVFGQLQNILTM